MSYDFPDDNDGQGCKSLNHHTPKDLCSVKYPDVDYAVRVYLRLKRQEEERPAKIRNFRPVTIFAGKTDIQSAFRVAPLKRACSPWLVMYAEHPETGEILYFVDKCLPFGASISCSHFQHISNGLRHIVEVKNRTTITNYLDDFLFLALTLLRCNYLLKQFLDICNQIGFPIAIEKTEAASEVITFLGILLNGHWYVLSLPIEKKERAEYLLQSMLARNKTRIRDLQALCRYLNFLGRVIYPGHVFTRRMYAKYSGLIDVKATNDMI